MRKSSPVILALFLVCAVQAQSEDDFKSPSSSLWNEVDGITQSSLQRFEKDKFTWLAYGAITTLFLVRNDMEFHEEYGLEKENAPLGLPRALGNLGELYDKPGPIYFSVGLAASMYGSGLVMDDYKMQETTHLMAKALIYTGVVTTVLKAAIGRARPYVDDDPAHFRPFNFRFDADYMSMPSGHTSSIFAMMTVLAKQYNEWYVEVPAYTFAISVAMQRMNTRKHWGSDLLLGGAIGYLVGNAVVERKMNSYGSLNIQPVLSYNGVGVAIGF